MSVTPAGPVAWSIDGTTFGYRAAIAAGVRLGGYVAIRTDAGRRLGQPLTQWTVHDGAGAVVEGEGRLLDPDDEAFEPSPLERADASELSVRFDADRDGSLPIGTLTTAPEVTATLDARGFNRHTFLCGQSGSGKTYALGLLLERLLLRTRLRLLVLDPNGDHVHLGRPRDDADPDVAEELARVGEDLTVLGAATANDALRVRFDELGMTGAAAVLQLDPIRDREEYNALLHLVDSRPAGGFSSVDAAVEALRGDDHVLGLVRQRLENLLIGRMQVWVRGTGPTLMERWHQDEPRALIADTSGFEQRRERLSVAIATLEQLWARRADRSPLLLVVDEAHDVCPAEPVDPLERHAAELFTRVAGEGRKYGIHLLLASQRPDKLPENVLSQCDNLVLMRVNSTGDRAAIAQRFGAAPAGLVELAGSFRLGQALVAGRIAPTPLLVTVGSRLTPEGGADIPTDWATGPTA